MNIISYLINIRFIIIYSLSHANTDIMNLKQENGLLRTNLKEYQKSLDECEMIQVNLHSLG